ncbi:hypothetical protein A1O1_07937 [Capronia coronata CBS 617.96]|uniref:Uncharacterized protein n=1 Tax=Capronia coronata CBS 617.96 TaxID=1182541 RepID=W9XMY4_9EURO|nr:uncharacterized protein A1O1_07937 [Capronia coronata CBS 617.96]EXJ81872.1 hypothetical protein A1O1_07937 [Capronia coronata CBS 617.96]
MSGTPISNPPCPHRNRTQSPGSSRTASTSIRENGDCSTDTNEKNAQEGPHSAQSQPPGASPVQCVEKLDHPLHTFSVNRLCQACQQERDMRMEILDNHVSQDTARRISARTGERNQRGFEQGRRIYRSSTALPMKMEAKANPSPNLSWNINVKTKLNLSREWMAGYLQGSEIGSSNAASPRAACETAVGCHGENRLAQNTTESRELRLGQTSPSLLSISSSCGRSLSLIPSPSTPVRLSFAALGDARATGAVQTR